ncbi:MAG: hypothetical protein Q8K92_12885 [Leadbetterella sp.]|nr:hypothetical protein [Leadbetterella sp.]
MKYIKLNEKCCQNPKCPNYGQKELGNLCYHGFSGKGKEIRMLWCNTCKTSFSERKGTLLFGSKLPEEKVKIVLNNFAEGNGIRKTSRLTNVSLSAVQRLSNQCSNVCENIHNEKVQHIKVKEAQFDEAWNFVGKKTKIAPLKMS